MNNVILQDFAIGKISATKVATLLDNQCFVSAYIYIYEYSICIYAKKMNVLGEMFAPMRHVS